MTDMASATPTSTATLAGARRTGPLSQFVRFALVGAGGYVVNLVTFALLVHGAGIDYRAAAVLAFLVAVANNFAWNRRWTFRAVGPGAVRQAGRFLAVSTLAAGLGLAILTALVDGLHLEAVAAQAIAIVAVTPLSFLANRRWTFAPRFDRRALGRERALEPRRRP